MLKSLVLTVRYLLKLMFLVPGAPIVRRPWTASDCSDGASRWPAAALDRARMEVARFHNAAEADEPCPTDALTGSGLATGQTELAERQAANCGG